MTDGGASQKNERHGQKRTSYNRLSPISQCHAHRAVLSNGEDLLLSSAHGVMRFPIALSRDGDGDGVGTHDCRLSFVIQEIRIVARHLNEVLAGPIELVEQT